MSVEALETNRDELAVLGEFEQAGILWKIKDVPDISDHTPGNERAVFLAKVDRWNTLAKDYGEGNAPNNKGRNLDGTPHLVIPQGNLAASEVYANDGMREWREKLVPTAVALAQIQFSGSRDTVFAMPSTNLDEPYDLSSGTIKLGREDKHFFTDALDAVAIRTRAKIMAEIVANHAGENPYEKAKWISLACGGAVPVLEALENRTGSVNLQLVDQDRAALNFARALALDRHLSPNDEFSLVESDLLTEMIYTDKLVLDQGEQSADVVDALGIFEYIPENSRLPAASTFLRNAYRLVKPGGVVVIANMLRSHPQLDFNQKVIGWPRIYPRTPEAISAIVSSAGINLEHVRGYIAKDGVYAVLEIQKPLEAA